MPILVSIFGFLLFFICHVLSYNSVLIKEISKFFNNAGMFNLVYNKIFLGLFIFSYQIPNKIADKGIIEYFGPFSSYKVFRSFSLYLKDASPYLLFFQISFFLFFLLFVFLLFIVHLELSIFWDMNYGMLFLSSLTFFLISLYVKFIKSF